GPARGVRQTARRRTRDAQTRPSGRERHDEKITVYLSADELFGLEQARLQLRGEHGLAVDRGRIVREAIAVLLADLEEHGERSHLVRRLRQGRER
ncbi:MAG: cobyrinic acid ac-diamide synthase, partial [Umezawaea sp.]